MDSSEKYRDIFDDISELKEQEISETEKQQLILARKGQGEFRKKLLEKEKKCRLTGIMLPELLIASHIKPWRISSNKEMLYENNGLLLAPHIDKLFDLFLISFTDSASLLYNAKVKDILKIWNIKTAERYGSFTEEQKNI